MSLPYEVSVRDLKSRLDAGETIRIIDVREPFEHAVARIEGAELIPMNTVPQRLQHLENEAEGAVLAVLCHHGMRSLNVVSWLRNQGVENCQSVGGGIDAWSLEVDSSVPRY